MIIKNLTNEIVTLRVRYMSMDRMELEQYVQPHARVKIDKAVVLNLPELVGKVEIEDQIKPVEVKLPEVSALVNTIAPIEEPTPDVEEVAEEVMEEPSVVEEKFICEECGAEFASARGLASHMNRVHNK